MIRAFTGPSKITASESRWVAEWVAALPPADEIRTGCANGVDTVAAVISARTLPDADHVLYIPDGPFNKDVVAKVRQNLSTNNVLEEIICPGALNGGRAHSYRIRNEMMVKGADELVAFVRSVHFYRSGEWMTINIAERLGVRVRKVVMHSA